MGYNTVTLPDYSVGEGCYREIPHAARHFGKKAVVIGGKTAMSKAKEKLLDGIKGSDMEITDFLWYGGQATYENGDRLMEEEAVKSADILFAVGGGRACDTVKYMADKMDKPLFCFPTVASNCAAVTTISVIYNPDGSLREYYFPKIADHTFIETSIIADSPRELLWAGIGDALSKEYESKYASTGLELSHTPLMGVQLGGICSGPLLRYGKKALEAIEQKKSTYELEQTALDIIISTGLVSNMVTHLPEYYYNSSIAHCVYNGSTVTPGSHRHLHGEIVSLGTLVQLTAAGEYELRDRIAEFNYSLGLPVCFADIDIRKEEFPAIIERAQTTTEWKYRPESRQITKEKLLEWMTETDRFGEAYKMNRK